MISNKYKKQNAKYAGTINSLKNNSLLAEQVQTEDILNLMKILSWGIPEERTIINGLCRQLCKRNKTSDLLSNI